ncbi:MAG: c-type cytochrome [Pseudomonadota bacterium]
MLDTMTWTKAAGGFLLAFLVLMLGGWLAESIYHVGADSEAAYVVEVEEDAPVEDDTPAVPFAEVFAAADAGKGERLWRQCSACHRLEDGANGTGPHLYAVVGRDIGSIPGFGYSEILTTLEGDWTPEALSGFLEDPRGYASGTKMSYAGMDDVEDRANLIAYLQSFGG